MTLEAEVARSNGRPTSSGEKVGPLIVHVITGLGVGGAERLLWAELQEINSDFRFVVISLCEGGQIASEIENSGIKVLTCAMRSFFDARALHRLYRYLRELRPQILHTHLFRASLWGRIVGRLAGVPSIVSSEHSLTASHFEGRRRNIIVDKIEAAASRLSDRCIAVSSATRKYQIGIGVKSERIVVIPNAIETDSLASGNPARIRKEFGIDRSDPVVLTVGRLHPQKGQEYLLRAFGSVVKRWARARLLVVGEGPSRSFLTNLSAELGLEPSVVFTGIRSDVHDLLAAADIFVLSSLWEPFGIALVEAMAAAKPTVASDVDGIPEIVQHEKTGLLVKSQDPGALEESICRLLEDPAYAHSLGAAGKERARSLFDIARHRIAVTEVYKSLLLDRAPA